MGEVSDNAKGDAQAHPKYIDDDKQLVFHHVAKGYQQVVFNHVKVHANKYASIDRTKLVGFIG
jgi:hypothetical protein